MNGSQPVPDPRSATAPPPSGRQTALVALGQGALMILGGLLALLVAQRFGKNAKTDAFFAAYGMYTVGVTFAGTFRLTAVSRLVQTKSPETITLLFGAVAVIAVFAGIPMVLLAGPLGRLLVETDPTSVAPTVLRILWIALAGQLLAAMLATVLAVRGAFTGIGLATLLSGFVSVGSFLLLASSVGVPAAAVALAASAVWLTAAFWLMLMRTGWRLTALTLKSLRAMCTEAGRLAFASATFIGTNLAYVICVALAARQGEGEATLFAYAYVLAAMLVGVTTNVSAMVRAPSLLAGPDRAGRAAVTGVGSFRFTLVLAGPVLAMAMLVGKPVIGAALGSGFSDEDIRQILVTLFCLVVWLLASAGAIFAVVELLARGELVRLAVLAGVQVAALLGLAAAGAALAGIEGIAATLSAVTLATSLVQLRWAFGEQWRAAVSAMARAATRELLVIGIAFAPAAVLLAVLDDNTLTRLAAAALAASLVAVASAVAWPREFRVLLALVRRSPRPAPAEAPSALTV